MSNFNKVVTNIPVSLTETEMSNLSQTFSGIIQGGGGGGEGKRYIGDGVYVTVNNDANPGVISLTQTSLDKLNKEIPSAVSSFPDSVQYAKKTYVDSTFQTKSDMSAYATTAYVSGVAGSIYYTNILGLVDALNAKQDTLTFGYDENDAISSINSHKLAGAGGVTGDYYSASNPSGFINSTQAETQILAKNYITSGVSELDNFYSKTDTSSKNEIANAIKDFITEDDVLEKHYLTKASGDLYYLPNPTELLEGTQYAYTTQGWSPIQGGGGASGISFVNHDGTLTGDGNTVKLGVDTTVIQTKLTDAQIQNITDVTTLKTASSTWDNVSAKLNTTDFNTYTGTTAPSTYQPIGNYLSSNALEGYATQDWVNDQGYITQETDWTNTIQEASAKAYNDATANANSLYQAKGDYVKNTDISLDANNKITAISGKELIITAHQSLTNYYTKSDTSSKNELSTEFGKYALKSEIPTKVSDLTDSANYYKTTETSSKNEITNALNTKVNKPTSTQTGKLVYDGDTSAWVSMPAGTTTIVQGTNGISAEYDNENTYTVGLSANYKAQIEAVSSKLTKASADTLYAPISVTGDVDTLKSSSGNWNKVSDKLDTTAFSNVSGTFLTKSSADNDYAPLSITANVNTLTAASAGWNNKVDKPTSLNDKYLVLRTDNAGNVSGWEDLKNECYSKTEATGTFVATANIDTTTLSGDGKTVSTKLGVKTDVIATKDYVNSSFLPLTGGTVTGQLEVHGGSNFDSQFIKLTREGNSCGARIGLGSDTTNGTLALKTFNGQGQNTVQVNIKHNTNNNELIQVQKSGSDVGFLIPAVTATTTAGLTNDGILHIILES